MKCLVVDDEPLARERLVHIVHNCEGWRVCGEAANGEQGLRQVEQLQPDVVLLDIRMPGMDGLEMARHMLNLDTAPAVIFTTAFGDHALAAFDTQAVDYLLKPVHPERLQQALQKARRLSGVRLQQLQAANTERARTHLCARVRGNLELIPVAQVVYLQADNKYVTVCCGARHILIEESLKSLEQEFADSFTRVHRNALVAVEAIRGLERDGQGHHRVVLEGVEEPLEVSRRMLAQVRRRIKLGAT